MTYSEDSPQHVMPISTPQPQAVKQYGSDFSQRIRVLGKFLFLGEQKFWIKGVTYGTFKPDDQGELFPAKEVVQTDFESMHANGVNTVRTYTVPPIWLLDLAKSNHLRVMVGLAWEQHVTFLDDRDLTGKICARVREQIRACGMHPAIFCYSIGNEIPANIIRWHGRRKIEKFLKRLYAISKEEDPSALVSYVNYPTTEYLQLSFLDLCCFNVYLESREKLDAYLARLQNLAWDKPLLLTEIGLDSQRHGVLEQAHQLEWQIRTAFASGCAGTFIFAWTDEWYRGGFEIEDWDFGLNTRERLPKPALKIVKKSYKNVPFPAHVSWPAMSVVVCSYNGEKTIRDTLVSLQAQDYPEYEVIVIDDGSTDSTPEISREYPFTLISTENFGLSNARNTGWQKATGSLVVYIDDDAYADPHWLKYLAYLYLTTEYVAVGGLSPAPPGDGPVADCVANAPGRPVHVLLGDRDAEHIPGCNMSFRRDILEAIGGFDPRYTSAGDDVDICWRILDRGWKIGYQAGALNWHHCRNSIKTYWKQQQGYGKAEAMLEEKWPEKYNTAGHLSWHGRIYGRGIIQALTARRSKIYQGKWGSAAFQSIYAPSRGPLWSVVMMPEWYIVIGLLAFLSILGLMWSPLLLVVPLLVVAIIMPVTQALSSAIKAEFPTPRGNRWHRFGLRGITSWLHLMQPVARLIGRLRYGLTPWRKRLGTGTEASWKASQLFHLWSEQWFSPDEWIHRIEKILKRENIPMVPGGDFNRWDIEIHGGLLGWARMLMVFEEHGGGKQKLRCKVRSMLSVWGIAIMLTFAVLSLAAALDGVIIVAVILIGIVILLATRARYETLAAAGAFTKAIRLLDEEIRNGS